MLVKAVRRRKKRLNDQAEEIYQQGDSLKEKVLVREFVFHFITFKTIKHENIDDFKAITNGAKLRDIFHRNLSRLSGNSY